MNNIKKARLEKGLSQKEVALTLNVSTPSVSDWESGKKFPAGKNLIELSKLLECSIDYLLGNDEDDSEAFAWLDDLTPDQIAEKCYEDFKIVFSRSANKTTHEQMKGFYIDTYKRFRE